MGRLAGRVAIITGAGRGIRASIARLLAREGAQVVVKDLGTHLDGSVTDSAPATEVVEQITKAGGTVITNVSGGINGRILHAAGYQVALYTNPQPISRIVGTGRWDLDSLATQIEQAFGPLLGRTAST